MAAVPETFAQFLNRLLFDGKPPPEPVPHSVTVYMGGPDASWQTDWRAEAVRNLRAVADRIEANALNPGYMRTLTDVNGNAIGAAVVNG